MGRSIAYAGSAFTIAFATCADGSKPALDFYNELEDSDKAKLNTMFRYLGDQGRIANPEKFKKVDDELWEFKSHQIRMPCKFGDDRTVIISHGFFKKGDKIPPEQIKRARRILQEDANRCAKEQQQASRHTKWRH